MSEPTEHDREQADATQLRLLAINLAAELRRARRGAGADREKESERPARSGANGGSE